MWMWRISAVTYLWLDLAYGVSRIQLIPQYPVTGGSVTLGVTGITEDVQRFSWFKGPSTRSSYRILIYDPRSSRTFDRGPMYNDRITPLDLSLHIKDLRMTDQGDYIAMIYAGHIYTLYVTLNISEPVTKPTITASTTRPKENDSLTLTCITSHATMITWTRLGPSISTEAKLSRDNKTLTFSSVTRGDSGQYQCHAQNLASKDSSDPYTVTVTYVTIQLIPQYPAINGSVILSVTGNTKRILNFVWYKGPSTSSVYQILTYLPDFSSPLTQGLLYSPRFAALNNGSLQIKDLQGTDEGGYIASIQTETSTMDIHVNLNVYELVTKPVIASSHCPVQEGDFYVLTCVTANAEKITWTRQNDSFPKGAEISADTRTVTFIDFTRSDVGEYQCEAENKVNKKISDIFRVGYISEGNSGSSPAVIAAIVCGTVLILVLLCCTTYLLYQNYILPSRMTLKDPCKSANPPPNKTKDPGRTHGKQEPSETYENVLALGSNYECSYKDLQFKTENVYNEIIR